MMMISGVRSSAPSGAALAALGLLLTVGCEVEQRANVVLDPSCSEGVRWAGLEGDTRLTDAKLWPQEHVGAPEMHPGRDCMTCHKKSSHGDHAPRFVVAGTAFGKLQERSDCYGVGGVTITVTDANKVSHELKSNSAGNFWLAAADAPEFKMPFTVKIRHNGREGQMYSPQTIGSCNNCHSASGKDP